MKKIVGASVLLVMLAGCGIGLPWVNLPPPGADHHNVLIVGDNLIHSAQSVLPAVLTEATIFDEHRDGSGLLQPIDGMSPTDFVMAMIDAHPTTDTVLAEWTGICADPCPSTYGSQEFYDAWDAAMQSIVEAVRGRIDPPTIVWVVAPPAPPDPAGGPFGFGGPVSDQLSWRTRATAAPLDVPLVDWWAALMAQDDFLGHWDQFLAFQVWPEAFATPHKVRTDDKVLFTVDGAFRASVWTAAKLREVWAAAA